MKEYFKNLPEIKFEGAASKNPFSFKYYDKERIIGGKKMSEWLRFAMSYWHTLGYDGTDMFGGGTIDKSFEKATPMDIHREKVYAAFEFMKK